MNCKDFLIDNPTEFEEAKKLVQKIFNTNQSFPNQVFNEKPNNFLFVNFDWAFYPDFYPSLIHLMHKSRDADVIVAMLEPDKKIMGTDYFFKVPSSLTSDEYGELMHYSPIQVEFETIGCIGEIVVWVPLSGKWAIWGQRGYETCVLSFLDKDCVIPQKYLPHMWATIEEALAGFMSLPYCHGGMPLEMKETYLANYSNPVLKKYNIGDKI